MANATNQASAAAQLSRPVVTVEVEQRLHSGGWQWLKWSYPSEHEAHKYANRIKRRSDVRAVVVVVVVVVEDGKTARYTIKSRFPRPPKQPSAEWLASMGMV